MAANKTARKEKGPESGASGSQLENAGIELSEEEIMEILQARQQYERIMEMARKYEEIMKSAEQKKKEIKPQVFKEIKEKYGMSEEEIRDTFTERARKEEIWKAILKAITEKGADVCKDEEFKRNADAWKRIRAVERMAEEDIKKIAVFMDEARRFLEEKTASEGRKEIHHTGRMNAETLQILKHVKENGGRVAWKDLLRYGKEELGLDTDTFNKRRWTLLTKGYIEREGADVKLTPKGYARLQEEGY